MNQRSQERIVELDGLRGVAILLVLWHHLIEAHLPLGRETWLGWLRAGSNLSWCGVDLFFVLSGFLIGGILLDHRNSPRLANVFYLRRSWRILPLYFLTLAFCVLCAGQGWLGMSMAFPVWVYGAFLTNFALAGLNGWDHLAFSVLWSLAIEEQFYLLAPWITKFLHPLRLPHFLVIVILCAWLLRILTSIFRPSSELAIHVLMPYRMDALGMGMLAAWLVRNSALKEKTTRLLSAWPYTLAVGLAFLFLLTLQRPKEGSLLLSVAGYTFLSLFFSFLLLVIVLIRPPLLLHILKFKPLVSLGTYSYFLYLWHAIIASGIINSLAGAQFVLNSLTTLLIILLAIGATWITAIASWKWMESPLIRYAHRKSY